VRIYTRTGDAGGTALFGGGRVPKSHPRVRAYGTLDELSSALGRALLVVRVDASRDRLARVQHDLFALGSHLSSPPPREGRRRPGLPSLPEGRIAEMERWMDQADEELEPLRSFILPGGSPGAAELHVCRTVCRRAERTVVALAEAVTRSAPGTASPDAKPGAAPEAGTAAEPDAAAEAGKDPEPDAAAEAGTDPEPDGAAEAAMAAEPSLAFAVRYLNRLSDLLFVLARLENHRSGTPDVAWSKEEDG
jgi:cob(I)alamin adenosyltransferase